jgi:hypothetical protein
MSKWLALLSVAALLAFSFSLSACGFRVPPSTTTTTAAGAAAASTMTTGGLSPSTSTSLGTTTTSSTTTTTTVIPTTTTVSNPRVFVADLSGSEQVPKVTSSASGHLTCTLLADGASLDFTLEVTNISGVTLARLRQGAAGTSGPVVATIYGGPTKSGIFTGELASGTLKAADLSGPLAGKTIADLVGLITTGQIYVNVGTTKNTNGEIRGQVEGS